jgi:hypothetical protein
VLPLPAGFKARIRKVTISIKAGLRIHADRQELLISWMIRF